MNELYNSCELCPRKCHINRNINKGICSNTSTLKLARSALHYFEEPSISSSNGSGTIFFSGCNLKCCYCQNKEISNDNFGINISVERLSELMLELQAKKASNINLVTPTHFVPSIIEAIKLARANGLSIPIVYNTSGYESINTIKLLTGYVDIYLTDFKYFDNKLGEDLSKVKNYFEVASLALEEMYKQVGINKFASNGIMTKGIIVRCLVLPTKGTDTKKIISYLYKKYQDNIYLSIMNQYTPVNHSDTFTFLNDKVSDKEYDDIINYALDLGIKNAYIQEGETQDESFIPPFNLEGL